MLFKPFIKPFCAILALVPRCLAINLQAEERSDERDGAHLTQVEMGADGTVQVAHGKSPIQHESWHQAVSIASAGVLGGEVVTDFHKVKEKRHTHGSHKLVRRETSRSTTHGNHRKKDDRMELARSKDVPLSSTHVGKHGQHHRGAAQRHVSRTLFRRERSRPTTASNPKTVRWVKPARNKEGQRHGVDRGFPQRESSRDGKVGHQSEPEAQSEAMLEEKQADDGDVDRQDDAVAIGDEFNETYACNPSKCNGGLTCKGNPDQCCTDGDWECCRPRKSYRLYCPRYGLNVMCKDGECVLKQKDCKDRGGVQYSAQPCPTTTTAMPTMTIKSVAVQSAMSGLTFSLLIFVVCFAW